MVERTCRRPGFTLVEMLIAVGLSALALGIVTEVMSLMRRNFVHGTVNLSQLQEARLALAYIRRDFLSACPRFTGALPWNVRLETCRHPIKFDAAPVPAGAPEPIQVTDKELIFPRFPFAAPDGAVAPQVERVSYQFDPTARTLQRTAPGHTVTFRNIRDVTFKVYVSQANPRVPLLMVKLVVFNPEPGIPESQLTPLEVQGTFGSAFLAGALNFPAWNFQGYQN